ncbi:FecR family protein [Rhodocaloribacter sp.]
MKQRPNIPNLPPEVEALFRAEAGGDPAAMGEVWTLCEGARPDLAPDPARKRAARAALLAAAAPPPAPSPLAVIADRLRRAARALTATPQRRWRTAAAFVTTVLVLGVFLALRPTTYHVPAGETLAVHLPDGSTVELNSASTLRVSGAFAWMERRVILDGEGFFEVVHTDDPFIVETFDAETRVLGTRFNVRARRTDPLALTRVAVASGKVGVRAKQAPGSRVILMAGQSAYITASGSVSLPDSVSLTQALAWREGGLAFHDQPLGAIFDEIERRFAIEIVADDAVRSRPQSYFKHAPFDAETVLSELTQMSGTRYRPIATGYEVYVP